MFKLANLASVLAVSGILLTGPAPAQAQVLFTGCSQPDEGDLSNDNCYRNREGHERHAPAWDSAGRAAPRRSAPMAPGASVSAAAAHAHIMVAFDE